MVVRIGDIGRAVRRVDRDLEEVEQRAVARRCAQVAAKTVDADGACVDRVIARFEDAPGRSPIDGLRHVDVPLVVRVVLRVGLRPASAGRSVEDDVGDAGRARRSPRHDRRVHAGGICDESWRRRGVPAGTGDVGLHHDVVAVGPDRVDLSGGIDHGDREDPVVPGADRAVIDLVISPADDRRAWCRHVSNGAHGLVHAVEVRRGREPLVDVVLRAVGRHEDRVERQCAAGRPPGDDVAQSVSGGSRWRVERTLPLRLRDVSRVDDRNVLNISLSAVS